MVLGRGELVFLCVEGSIMAHLGGLGHHQQNQTNIDIAIEVVYVYRLRLDR